MAKQIWSRYQTAIFETVRDGKKNVVIEAVAGSGKTTTIVECANVISRSNRRLTLAYFAFNKSAADNLKKELSGTAITCSTTYAFGLDVIRRHAGRNARYIKISGNKYRKYFSDNFWKLSKVITIDTATDTVNRFVGNLTDLLTFARRDLLKADTKDIAGCLNELCEKHDINTVADEIDIIVRVIDDTYLFPCPLTANGYEVSFDDMVTLPLTVDGMAIPTYDRVFIDEAQDLTAAQKSLMMQAVSGGGRFIAVGDSHQTLYGFCGCKNALQELSAMPDTVTMPLSVCYRCASSIINKAKAIVPNIEAAESAAVGTVKESDNVDTLQRGDMVIARRKADVITLCLKGIKDGRPVTFVGESIKNRLKAFVLSLGCKYTSDMPKAVQEARERAIGAFMKRHDCDRMKAEASAYMQRWDDTQACALLLMQGTETQREVLAAIDAMFRERNPKDVITFATIHTAKGLQADTVHIINSPRSNAAKTDDEVFAESCAEYVAYTRAKNVLNLVTLTNDQILTAKTDRWGV